MNINDKIEKDIDINNINKEINKDVNVGDMGEIIEIIVKYLLRKIYELEDKIIINDERKLK